eukprot:1095560-Prorocentrum_minimum.AAC.2
MLSALLRLALGGNRLCVIGSWGGRRRLRPRRYPRAIGSGSRNMLSALLRLAPADGARARPLRAVVLQEGSESWRVKRDNGGVPRHNGGVHRCDGGVLQRDGGVPQPATKSGEGGRERCE